jgi:hypothetical protein
MEANPEATEVRGVRVRRTALVAASALVSINLWTGGPLFALWVGSKVQASFSSPKMEAVAATVVVLAIVVFGGAMVLTWLNARYDELVGRKPEPRRRYPWLESMRGERQQEIRRERGISAIERVVVISVVAAALAFEVWFFFFAGSSLPNA